MGSKYTRARFLSNFGNLIPGEPDPAPPFLFDGISRKGNRGRLAGEGGSDTPGAMADCHPDRENPVAGILARNRDRPGGKICLFLDHCGRK